MAAVRTAGLVAPKAFLIKSMKGLMFNLKVQVKDKGDKGEKIGEIFFKFSPSLLSRLSNYCRGG